MKKIYFLLVACMVVFTSCTKHHDDLFKLQIDQLEGEWVYDHPEEGVWETQTFYPSGVFYYSNKVDGGWKLQNSMNEGRYWIDGDNKVTCQYLFNGVSSQVKMTVLEITPYSYTAEYNDGAILGRFTYARLLSEVELIPGETKAIDYSSMVKIDIKGFKTHNAKIATVDNSGNITAVGLGHTYVDVVTDEGTAVIEVIVFDRNNMFGDYSFAFGKTIPEIIEIVGQDYILSDDNVGVIYYLDDYLADELAFITGLYDTSHVEFVKLTLNDNISKTVIIAHLKDRYTYFSDADGIYNFITDQTVNNNPIAIIYDTNKSTLSYVVLKPSDRWTDFSYLFGQSDSMVNSEMKELGYTYFFSDYTYSKDGSDYYIINDSNDASMVGFVFNGENKMCEYWVYLYDDYMSYANDIISWLKSKYVISTEESSNTQIVFYDNANRMRIVFDASGYVSYTDSKQTPFTPASAALHSLDRIKNGQNNVKPNVTPKYYNLKVPTLIKN